MTRSYKTRLRTTEMAGSRGRIARTRRRASAIALGAFTVTTLGLAFPTNAWAVDTYRSDRCSSSGNNRCVMLNYNSGGNGWWSSSCFISNINISNYAGYYAGDGINVHYVFDSRSLQYSLNYGTSSCQSSSGKGQQVKNNAAAVGNNLTADVRVYYNSGYSGPSDTIGAGNNRNLSSTLKNDNASQKILN